MPSIALTSELLGTCVILPYSLYISWMASHSPLDVSLHCASHAHGKNLQHTPTSGHTINSPSSVVLSLLWSMNEIS